MPVVAFGAGAQTWLVKADPAENQGRFQHLVQSKSGDVSPLLLSGA